MRPGRTSRSRSPWSTCTAPSPSTTSGSRNLPAPSLAPTPCVRLQLWPPSLSAEGAFAIAGQGGAAARHGLPAPVQGVMPTRRKVLYRTVGQPFLAFANERYGSERQPPPPFSGEKAQPSVALSPQARLLLPPSITRETATRSWSWPEPPSPSPPAPPASQPAAGVRPGARGKPPATEGRCPPVSLANVAPCSTKPQLPSRQRGVGSRAACSERARGVGSYSYHGFCALGQICMPWPIVANRAKNSSIKSPSTCSPSAKPSAGAGTPAAASDGPFVRPLAVLLHDKMGYTAAVAACAAALLAPATFAQGAHPPRPAQRAPPPRNIPR